MAVDQSDSFQLAEHILLYLTHNGYIENKVAAGLVEVSYKIFINFLGCNSGGQQDRSGSEQRNKDQHRQTASSEVWGEIYWDIPRYKTETTELCTTSHIPDISGINHNIDELLVGIFTQINLRQKKPSSGHSLNKVKLFIYYQNNPGHFRLEIFF